MLNERTMDAHIGVLPMYIYFFGDHGQQMISVTVDKDWVGMEKISAENMANGVVSETSQEVKGNFAAGHGKRKYFTTNLVNELRAKATTMELTDSRDRIYFYINENLVLEDREAIITFEYFEKENGVFKSKGTEQRKIEQTHLLPVEVWIGDGTYENAGGDDKFATIYMEAIEEYLDNYDPLDPYNSNQVYTGLPWGYDEKKVLNINYGRDECYNNYVEGLAYTIDIVRTYTPIKEYTLNSIDSTTNAFLYCYNKNKRCDSSGDIKYEFKNPSWFYSAESYYDRTKDNVNNLRPLFSGNHAKWFLPGITQLERALEKYYSLYPEFQGNLYWSSAVGKVTTKNWIGTSSSSPSTKHARATNLTADGNHVGSESKEGDEQPGYKRRTEKCRVRAFRVDLNPMTND
jgi:hypothetical protein